MCIMIKKEWSRDEKFNQPRMKMESILGRSKGWWAKIESSLDLPKALKINISRWLQSFIVYIMKKILAFAYTFEWHKNKINCLNNIFTKWHVNIQTEISQVNQHVVLLLLLVEGGYLLWDYHHDCLLL